MKRIYYKNWDEMPAILTIDQVAIICNRTRECVRRWAKDGKIPAYRIPDGWVVDKEMFKTWLLQNGNQAVKAAS